MEAIIERAGGVSNDPLNVGMAGLDKVHSGNIVNGFAVLVNEEVKGHTMLTKVLNMDQWGEYVLAKLIIDQDLVHLFVGHTSCINGLVQIQHTGNTFCLPLPQIESHGREIYILPRSKDSQTH